MNIIIKNGVVIDLREGVPKKQIISIDHGIIEYIGNDIEKDYIQNCMHVIDAEGCYVVPGLIDFHTHLFEKGSDSGINPDISLLPCGVTSAVDAGSAGSSNYELFSKHIISSSKVSIKSFLNVSPAGLIMVHHHNEVLNPEVFSRTDIEDVVQRHRDEIIGLKVRFTRSSWELGLEPLKAAVNIAEYLGLPVMVHPVDPPEDVDKIFDILRKGDIFSHMYHDSGFNILDEHDRLKPCVHKARSKGIIFEVAAGRRHISFHVAQKAIREGFLPDIISTDETKVSMYLPPLHSLPSLMSVFLNMGVSLQDVVRMTTQTPSELMGTNYIYGSLREGNPADIAVFSLSQNKKMQFSDLHGNLLSVDKLFIPQITIKGGTVVYRQVGF